MPQILHKQLRLFISNFSINNFIIRSSPVEQMNKILQCVYTRYVVRSKHIHELAAFGTASQENHHDLEISIEAVHPVIE
jgi:hypothetical protein